jgi:hypothetical protein
MLPPAFEHMSTTPSCSASTCDPCCILMGLIQSNPTAVLLPPPPLLLSCSCTCCRWRQQSDEARWAAVHAGASDVEALLSGVPLAQLPPPGTRIMQVSGRGVVC